MVNIKKAKYAYFLDFLKKEIKSKIITAHRGEKICGSNLLSRNVIKEESKTNLNQNTN